MGKRDVAAEAVEWQRLHDSVFDAMSECVKFAEKRDDHSMLRWSASGFLAEFKKARPDRPNLAVVGAPTARIPGYGPNQPGPMSDG